MKTHTDTTPAIMPARKTSEARRYRRAVLSRIGAAALGGYALASALAAVLAMLLPLARADAVIVATLASFLFFALAIIWVFAARSAARAWLGLLAPTALLAAWLFISLSLR